MRGGKGERAGSLARVAMSLAIMLASARPVLGQDLEASAERAGIPLPAGYWARIAENPVFFELPNGMFGRRQAHAPLAAPGMIPQPAGRAITGQASFPIILALFSDSPEPPFSPAEIDRAVFSGPSPTGTFAELYSEMSRGQFNVTGDVLPWVRTSMPMAEVVGSDRGLGGDAKVGQYLIEALVQYDAGLDFGEYDNDGPDGIPNSGDDDGIVDVVTLEYLEVAASCGGPAIWPHRSGISFWTGQPWASNDVGANGSPILVDGYITQSVTDCSGITLQTAGTISHEYGHALGLPDYYHPVNGIDAVNRRWVIGCWALMAAGSWGCGQVGSERAPYGPIHMTSYSKWQLGWLDFIDVDSDQRDRRIDFGGVQLTGDAVRVPMDASGRQFLLFEYRQQVGFDQQLPAAGILVMKLDLDGSTRPQGDFRYRLSVLEADGDRGLLRTTAEGGDRGVPGDVFGRNGVVSTINNSTNPSTRDGLERPTRLAVHEIGIEGGRAFVRFSNAATPELETPAEPLSRMAASPGENRLRILGGVIPYTATAEQLPGGLTLDTDGDDLVIGGGVVGSGDLTFEVLVRDNAGNGGVSSVTLRLDPFEPDPALLVAPWTGVGRALTEPELRALDEGGNANGRYDVGDLRAWMFGG